MNIPILSLNSFVLLLLLLFSSIGFSFPATVERDAAVEQNFVPEADLQQKAHGLAETFRSSWRLFTPDADVLFRERNYRLLSFQETRSGNEYLRGSKVIQPGLDIPAIIYPFHVFL